MDNLWRSFILGGSGNVADSLHAAAHQTSKPKLKSINHPKLLIQMYLWLPLLCTQDPASGISFRLTCAPSREEEEEEEEEDFHFVSSLHSSQIMPITSESILKMTNCTNMPEVFVFFYHAISLFKEAASERQHSHMLLCIASATHLGF